MTRELRDFFLLLTSENQELIRTKFTTLLRTQPADALRIFAQMAEFVIPKLARTEMVGGGGGPIQTQSISASYAANDPAAAVQAYQAFLESGKPKPDPVSADPV